MNNKIILVLSCLIAVNTVLGDVGGEEDVFETKEDVFGSNEAQPVHQETATTNNEVKEKPTIANEELKVQVIPDRDAFYERNGFVIQKGMDQYIIEGVIYQIDGVLEKLRPLYTDKAKKLGKKPIVFKQLNVYNPCDIPTEETDEFSIERFMVYKHCYNLSDFEAFYNALSKFGKPIVFDKVFASLKDEIEKKYDLNDCGIYYYNSINHFTSFDDYLKFAKFDIENLSFGTIRVFFTPFSEEQMLKEKLKLALKYLKGESIEELKKGVELLLGLNLKQKIR
ncbi:MAG: hypothetical protein ACLRFH_02390, partial [Opitutales bacterium]